jgi:AraC family transcriptional regulator, positive regulator of tynA and feaB
MISVSTDTIPTRDRAEFWADLVSRHVTPIRIDPTGERPLRGEIHARAIGNVGVARVAGMGVHAVHTRAHVARAGGHLYGACVHLEGETRITRRGETITLQQGDIFITDSRQEFRLDLDRPWRHLLIALPTHYLDSRVARPDLLAGAVLRTRPLVRLWASHLANGFALASALTPVAAALFARHSIELLLQLLGESNEIGAVRDEALRAAIFVSACQVIALKFGDPGLTPACISGEVGVSSRTLARVFAERDTSIMRRVFDERVDRAASLLAAPECARRSITDIAFACGFKDLSHFGRLFSARMHATPSQWRRSVR